MRTESVQRHFIKTLRGFRNLCYADLLGYVIDQAWGSASGPRWGLCTLDPRYRLALCALTMEPPFTNPETLFPRPPTTEV